MSKEMPKTNKNIFAAFLKDENGATAIEYGMIAVMISIAIVAGVTGIGNTIQTKFYAGLEALL